MIKNIKNSIKQLKLCLAQYKIFSKCKIFSSGNIFSERKIFSSILLHLKKCFGKYFNVFGCVLENPLKNILSTSFSHFLSFQNNIIIENSNI